MKSILPIVLVAAFVVPVRADDCSDFRLALHERDSARLLLTEGAADEDTPGELMGDAALAARRVDRATQALVASRGDHMATEILEALDEAQIAAHKASEAVFALDGGPRDASTRDLRAKVMLVHSAVEETREALVRTLCP